MLNRAYIRWAHETISLVRRAQKEKNEKIVSQLARAIEVRKRTFRQNVLSKLTFLYPDMDFAIGMTSDQFAGYSPKENILVSGKFLDRFLPDLYRIQDLTHDSEFETHAAIFTRDIENLIYESDISDADEKRRDERYNKEFLRRRRDYGYVFDDDFLPYEIMIKKNGRMVGRATSQSRKPFGYFAEKAYTHVVEDINGTGISNFSIELALWNYGNLRNQEISFFYTDTPRKSVSQMRDHYIKTCSQFVPFLQSAERILHDPAWREATSTMGFIKTDQELGLGKG